MANLPIGTLPSKKYRFSMEIQATLLEASSTHLMTLNLNLKMLLHEFCSKLNEH
jgi:hypothetical protein